MTISMALMLAILIGCAVFVMGIFNRSINPPPYYVDSPSALQITQSQMFFRDTTNGPRIYITGMLTNQSPVAWRDLEFECRFFGTNGNLTDAYPARSHMTVLANDDAAFRISVSPFKERQEYATFKVFLTDARNKKGIF